jgi:alanyl-tRNA synthetase
VGVIEDPPSVLLAVSADAGIDAGKALKAALAEAGGRGGGSPRMAQGSVPSKELLDQVLTHF